MTTFKYYQTEAETTNLGLVDTSHPVFYNIIGMTDELGEFVGKIKKIFRDRGGVITKDDRMDLTYEIGDVLWYMSQVCSSLDISFEFAAEMNLEKLASRYERGMIQGDGDDR